MMPFMKNPYYRKNMNTNNYGYYSNYNNYYPNYYNHNNLKTHENMHIPYSKVQISNKTNVIKKEEEKEPEIIELFGLKLHFDDILLICLIFFLYNEGVKDPYLFISLVLLLMS